ncbi:MAG: peptidase T [Bacteroidetes bacterium]|nr:peptidase T [Bacteroidota bacterium]
MFTNYQFTVVERFLRYVKIDTQSDPGSTTIPSTEKQKNLSRILVSELNQLGINNAEMDDYGYVYATILGNTRKENIPAIFFCSHVDTSPDCSGVDVEPIIHTNYNGSHIHLPKSNQPITIDKHPELKNQIGNDIITASGNTLLGADNKSGVAEIMDAANFLMTHPEVKHGDIRILFTPDEEIGRGADKVDVQKLNATFGYTMDGETAGDLENETFSADAVTIKIKGVASHPGYAKGLMENAIKIAAEIIAALPKVSISPETTNGMQGFIHPTKVDSSLEHAVLDFIIRDFEVNGLHQLEEALRALTVKVMSGYPNSTFEFIIKEQYRNMKEVLDKHPHVTDYAIKAIERAGLKPRLSSIRGGTDGSRLSFMGLPCPNIFAGEHAFHGAHEWVSIQDMQKAVETIVHLCCIVEENN